MKNNAQQCSHKLIHKKLNGRPWRVDCEWVGDRMMKNQKTPSMLLHGRKRESNTPKND